MKIERDDLEPLREKVDMLAHAFHLRDHIINVDVPEDECKDCQTHAEVHFKTHWEVTIVFHDKFFEESEREQLLTICHELTHVLHRPVDEFAEAMAGEDDQVKRVYESTQEKFVEAMERVFASILPQL